MDDRSINDRINNRVMMRIILGSVGKLKSGSPTDLFQDYVARLGQIGKSVGFSKVDLLEVPESDPKSEYELLSSKIPKGGKLFVFDERGRTMTTREFSSIFQDFMSDGVESCTCIIGGADGLHPSWHDTADDIISFGKLTLPHQLVRIIVAEQLYRVATILQGHPYHRD